MWLGYIQCRVHPKFVNNYSVTAITSFPTYVFRRPKINIAPYPRSEMAFFHVIHRLLS